MERTEPVRRVRLSVMLVLGVAAAVAAGLLALMWWQVQPAGAVTDPGRIVFVSDRNYTVGNGGSTYNPNDIYSMKPDGSDVVRLTEKPGWEWNPSISPDGSKVVFMGTTINPDGSWSDDIYVVNADGSGGLTNVTRNRTNENGIYEFYPSWSASGQKLVVMGVRYDSNNWTWTSTR